MNFPYIYVSCPCTDVSTPLNPDEQPHDNNEEQERTFDPRSPRANFSLYPPEHLLYCEECQEIRCPRCIIEEIVCWYCPSCLFEMPLTMVKSEGGRCPRNCFNCPVCTSPLAISSMNPDPNTRAVIGPFVLTCGFCQWSSLDINWQFDKLSNIPAQMRQLSMGGEPRPPSTPRTPGSSIMEEPVIGEGPDAAFAQLKSFYNSQLAVSNGTDPLLTPSGGFNYASPASLARIMSIYNTRTPFGKPKDTKLAIMRESAEDSEGLRIMDGERDREIIEKLRSSGWAATSSTAQRAEQQRHPPRFVDDLRPTQTLLRTKRNKRCRSCRHILVKPEPKVQNTRFRIRLLAIHYIPTIAFTPLQPPPSLPSTNHPPTQTNSHQQQQQQTILGSNTQYLLTLTNPLFDPVKITLATPSHIPPEGRRGGRRHGKTRERYRHKVTVLCPDFSIGPNVDQWDEALAAADGHKNKDSSNRKGVSTKKMSGGQPRKAEEGATAMAGGEGGKVAEAGKVWDRGRNWTSVVVEVGEVAVPMETAAFDNEEEEKGELGDEDADEDVLEIPVFVRMEWEGDVVGDEDDSVGGGGGRTGEGAKKKEEGKGGGGGEGKKERREVAFWSVIGVGRVG